MLIHHRGIGLGGKSPPVARTAALCVFVVHHSNEIERHTCVGRRRRKQRLINVHRTRTPSRLVRSVAILWVLGRGRLYATNYVERAALEGTTVA